MGLATLGGVTLRIDPDTVRWTFGLKVSRKRTVGGTVVQVFGADLGDMTLSAWFGNGDRGAGDTEGWQEQERFVRQVQEWVKDSARTSASVPLLFSYPPRGWRFQVFVKALSARSGDGAVAHDVATFNPGFTLTLFIVEDSTRKVVTGIKDLYIQRLMSGIGWKQSAYNGPLTQAEVDQVLAPFGGDLKAYLSDQFDQAAGFQPANVPEGTGVTPSTGSSGSVDDWITQAAAALGRTFTASERAGLKIIAEHESTNDPKAVNNTDSNARAGHPTKGLMQMRDDTFAAHALPGHNDIFDPVDNLIAAIRYIEDRYNSIDSVPGVKAIRAGRSYVGY